MTSRTQTVRPDVPLQPVHVSYPLRGFLERLEATEQVRVRAAQDMIAQVDAGQLRKRAELIEWCRPRQGDFNGRATPAQLAATDERLRKLAQGYRDRAEAVERGWLQ